MERPTSASEQAPKKMLTHCSKKKSEGLPAFIFYFIPTKVQSDTNIDILYSPIWSQTI